MSMHTSLKGASKIRAKRNVLKRFERIELLKKDGKWKDGDRVDVRLPMHVAKTRGPKNSPTHDTDQYSAGYRPDAGAARCGYCPVIRHGSNELWRFPCAPAPFH